MKWRGRRPRHLRRRMLLTGRRYRKYNLGVRRRWR